ncbi:siderophore-iron reductase FhuF [Cupriavidus sp. D384]|uniref:siderophore-iron reductase FhuF n=1 Tax=Cupriavidus sp. D384 TaxID=1538095 RepID=UPI0008337696|nr:siderophore-iron reductase FhuF [Cupriavidus sp. D384]
MLDFLAPFFTGPLRPFGERLHAGGALTMQAAWPAEALARCAQTMACDDPRALAAAWFRDYTKAVLPGALVAAAVFRRRLPFEGAGIEIGDDGRLAALRLADVGVSTEESLPALLSPLMDAHLPLLVDALAVASRASPRLLWCTGGVSAHGIARQLAAHPALGAKRRAELLAWIGNGKSADGYQNPLHGAFRPSTEPGTPGVAPLRRVCCLGYRLPNEGHCGTCPRVAAIAARRERATDATATTL